MIVGEDADVYGDVKSEQREEPEHQNETGKDPTSSGYGGGSHGHCHDDGDGVVMAMLVVVCSQC